MVVPFKEAVVDPTFSYLSNLDEKMKGIVESQLKPDEKIKQYNYLLDNFRLSVPDQNESVPEALPPPTHSSSNEFKPVVHPIKTDVKTNKILNQRLLDELENIKRLQQKLKIKLKAFQQPIKGDSIYQTPFQPNLTIPWKYEDESFVNNESIKDEIDEELDNEKINISRNEDKKERQKKFALKRINMSDNLVKVFNLFLINEIALNL